MGFFSRKRRQPQVAAPDASQADKGSSLKAEIPRGPVSTETRLRTKVLSTADTKTPKNAPAPITDRDAQGNNEPPFRGQPLTPEDRFGVPKKPASTSAPASAAPETRPISNVQFRTLASDRPNKEAVSDDVRERARIALREVMGPSTPVQNKDYFAGRINELERAISAIEDERMHLVVYGKRGWGKTSFANTLTSIAQDAGYLVCRTACSQATTFEGLFRAFLKTIPLLHDRQYLAKHGAETANLGFDTMLPEDHFTAKELTDVLSNLTATRVLFVLDEFDRSDHKKLKHQIAEAIKSFSDNAIRATFIIVGVADTLDDLLGIHESIQRNIAGIPMRLLSPDEYLELIKIGETATGIIFPQSVRDRIANLSRQIPHFTRLLCLHAGQRALGSKRWSVEMQDLDVAIEQACADIGPLLDLRHRKLMTELHNAQSRAFLYSLASVPISDEGDFTIDDIVTEYQWRIDKPVTKLSIGNKLSMLTKPEISLLTKLEKEGRTMYRLQEPLTGFYLRLMQELQST